VHLLCAVTDQAEYINSLGIVVHPFSFTRSGKNLFKELTCFIKLYRLVKSIQADLLHLVTIKPVIYGGIIARLTHVPAVVSAISGLGFLFVEREGFTAKLLRDSALFLYRFAMRHPNQRVIFQNPTDMKALVSAGGVKAGKTRMIRGFGVDLDKYTMAPEPQSDVVIIMASRLLKDKGVYEFVEAAMKIKAKGINVRFQLVGEPDFLSLSLYSDIADYATESEMWVGFQANFFVYTVFWCLGFYFSQRYVKQEYIENYIRLWKFYCVLMMAYFFFRVRCFLE